MSVLNICNQTAKKRLLLNDLKLMQLVQTYPFLYNPRVPPHKDPDYDEWAWEKIAAQFNQTYGDVRGFCKEDHFSADALRVRWGELRPLVINLSKMCDTNAMPAELKVVVGKLATQLGDSGTEPPSRLPSAGAAQVILDNIEMVNRLPPEERLKLEAEMMELLLSAELSGKSTKKLSSEDLKRIQQECDACLIDMGLHKSSEDASSDEDDGTKTKKTLAANQRDDGATKDEKQEEKKPKPEGEAAREQRNTPPLLKRRTLQETEAALLATRLVIQSTGKPRNTRNSHKASLRQCVVRLKRMNFDAYFN